MSNNAITKQDAAGTLEQVMVSGDLKALTAEQRVKYYNQVCQSMGLNPLTRPFDYLTLNGRLLLYARKDAADQLRNLRGVSITDVAMQIDDDLIIVTVKAANADGRMDTDLGVVTLTGLRGEAKANAIMKAITKGKRRVTLSICGLGWLDETEIETIPDARPVVVSDSGEIVTGEAPKAAVGTSYTTQAPPSGNGHATKTDPKPSGPLAWMVEAGYAENVHSAAQIANKLEFGKHGRDEQERLANIYRAWRDVGTVSDVAAEHAKAGNLPLLDVIEREQD